MESVREICVLQRPEFAAGSAASRAPAAPRRRNFDLSPVGGIGCLRAAFFRR